AERRRRRRRGRQPLLEQRARAPSRSRRRNPCPVDVAPVLAQYVHGARRTRSEGGRAIPRCPVADELRQSATPPGARARGPQEMAARRDRWLWGFARGGPPARFLLVAAGASRAGDRRRGA